MQFYFFKQIDKEYSSAFQQFAIRQNIVNTKVFSVLIAALCIVIKISALFINYDLLLPRASSYQQIHTFLLFCSIVSYSSILYFKRTRNSKRYYAYNIISIFYGFVLIISCLWISFVSQHNPGNSMTMFLIGVIIVAVLWILDVSKTIVFALLFLAALSFGLQYFQTNPEKLLGNYVVGVCTVISFFCISRICYSYHYTYFVQLSSIARKNEEINEINKTQTEILGIVAHDLRSPINNISTLVELSREKKRNGRREK